MDPFNSINPATGQVLGQYAHSTRADLDTALASASAAFEAARDFPFGWQAALLDEIAEQVMQLGDALLTTVEAESALPRPRVTGERGRTCAQLKMFAVMVREGSWLEPVIDLADADRKPAPRPDLRRMLIPRGPVAVFGASNFPLAFGAIGGDTASALAGGNPVIVKGHPSHPGTSALVASAIATTLEKLHLPPGLFSLLQGQSHELSNWLVTHPDIQAVGFTGSQKAGRALFDLAAKRRRPIPVFAEMGSLNPLVILPAAIAERAPQIAQGLAASIVLGAGQFCTKPGVIITLGDAGGFTSMLVEQLQKTERFTLLNQNLRNTLCTRTDDFSALKEITTLLKGQSSDHASTSASLFELSAVTFIANPSLREEAFGPAALLVKCRSFAEIIDVLHSIGGSLTATLHTGNADDPATVKRILRTMEIVAGRVILNGFPTGVEVNHAIVHGGPYPATTDANSTSVGTGAARRFMRMIAFQDTPDSLLPTALQDANPAGISRMVNGRRTTEPISLR